MKNKSFIYIIVGSGAILVLYLLNQNKKLTEKSEAYNCDNEGLMYNKTTKKCWSWEELGKSVKQQMKKKYEK
jgi:hypothetical protein